MHVDNKIIRYNLDTQYLGDGQYTNFAILTGFSSSYLFFSISIFSFSPSLSSLWKFGQHFDAEGTFEGSGIGFQGSSQIPTKYGRRSLQPVSILRRHQNSFQLSIIWIKFFSWIYPPLSVFPGEFFINGRIGFPSRSSATRMQSITGPSLSVSTHALLSRN